MRTIFILIIFFTVSLLSAQEKKLVEIEAQLYKPKKEITKVLKEISLNSKCFESNDSISNRQHLLIFVYNTDEDRYFLGTTSSANILDDALLTWDDLIVSGILFYKGDIVFLAFNRDCTDNTKKFFRKTRKKVKVNLPYSNSTLPFCGATFEIIDGKFFLLEKKESWKL